MHSIQLHMYMWEGDYQQEYIKIWDSYQFFPITVCTVTCVFENVISRNVTIKCDLRSLEDFYVYIRGEIFQ